MVAACACVFRRHDWRHRSDDGRSKGRARATCAVARRAATRDARRGALNRAEDAQLAAYAARTTAVLALLNARSDLDVALSCVLLGRANRIIPARFRCRCSHLPRLSFALLLKVVNCRDIHCRTEMPLKYLSTAKFYKLYS